jgi:glycosyltransferase involved in cell wall biosynthesis
MTSYIFYHNEWTDTCLLEGDAIKRTSIIDEFGKWKSIGIETNTISVKWDKWSGENIFVLGYDNCYYLECLKVCKFKYPDCEKTYIIDTSKKIVINKNDNSFIGNYKKNKCLFILNDQKFVCFNELTYVHVSIIKNSLVYKTLNDVSYDYYVYNNIVNLTTSPSIINNSYCDNSNITKIVFDNTTLINTFYKVSLPFELEKKSLPNTKVILTLVEWGYPPFGGGENWLLDMNRILIETGDYIGYLICFSDPFNNDVYKETRYTRLNSGLHVIQMEKNIQNIIKTIKIINPDIINHQGVNRMYYMKIANLLQIPFVTGFCFWQNIIKMNFTNFNIGMMYNNNLEKCDEFDEVVKYSYPYSSSIFVNDIIFKLYKITFPIIETISHPEHYYLGDEYKKNNNNYVTIVNCHYNKGGHIIKYLCENLDLNIPLLFVYTEHDPIITPQFIEELLLKRNDKKSKIICQKTDIKKIYQMSKIILIPSLCDETFCRIGYEAMMNGIPIISTTSGNLKYLLDNYAIFLPCESDFYDIWKMNIEIIYSNKVIFLSGIYFMIY